MNVLHLFVKNYQILNLPRIYIIGVLEYVRRPRLELLYMDMHCHFNPKVK